MGNSFDLTDGDSQVSRDDCVYRPPRATHIRPVGVDDINASDAIVPALSQPRPLVWSWTRFLVFHPSSLQRGAGAGLHDDDDLQIGHIHGIHALVPFSRFGNGVPPIPGRGCLSVQACPGIVA